MSHEQAENVGAYALGALSKLEAQVFERHLMGCDSCQDELQRLNEAVGALPLSVEPYSAPASLKRSLMDVVAAEAPAQAPVRAERPRRERFGWLTGLRPALALGTAAVAVAIAFAAGSQLGDDRGGGPETVAARVDERRAPAASASLLVPSDGARGAVLRVHGLPDPGEESIYQVWVERQGEVVPVSIFSVDSRGAGAAAIPESLEDVTAVMVTRERRGGAAAPTDDPLITAEV